MNKDLALPDHEALIKKMAWEIARNVLDHHKNVYPHIFAAAPSTFEISMRNGIYNQIAYAIKCRNDAEIRAWIADSEAQRKAMRRLKRLQKKALEARGNPEKMEEILHELRKGP